MALRRVFDEARIASRVGELAAVIAASSPPDLVVVAVLKGGAVFAADLVRALSRAGVAPGLEFLRLASYGANRRPTREVRVLGDSPEVAGGHVLVADAICETGRTLERACAVLTGAGAATVRTCVLVDKSGGQAASAPDYAGFTAAGAFLVGYGTDAAEAYRHLPYLAELGNETGP